MDGTSAVLVEQLQAGPRGPDHLTCIEGKYCNKPEEVENRVRGKPELVLKPCKCRSDFCEKCSLGKAVELREMLRPVVVTWEAILLATLTIDPKAFTSPLEAWRYVGEKRAISVMQQRLRRLGVLLGPEWFSVLEFHKSGWPHWHVLFNARFIPHADLLAAWKLGHVSLSRTKGFGDPVHALHYATKYVAKPDVAMPEWVANFTGKIRRFSTSRGLLGSDQKRYEDNGAKRQYAKRSIADRVADCETTFKRFKRDGEKYEFAGMVRPLEPGYGEAVDQAHEANQAFDAWKNGAIMESSHSGTKRESEASMPDDRWERAVFGESKAV